jgi:Na+/proline symporter
MTFLQLAIGAIAARVIIGVWFVPAFYQREIYSPYDYVGDRLGPPARTVTTGLFILGAVLGQSVRVLTTAFVLELMTGIPLWGSIWIIGAVAIGWTLLGGITTVIWTDVLQFAVFVVGLLTALVLIVMKLPGGWEQMVETGEAAGKFQLLDTRLTLDAPYTIWAALIGSTFLCLNAYGTDQLIAQRMFCCRGPREARKAMIWSSVAQIITVIALLVGVGLYAFYQQNPLEGEALRLVNERGDRIFPIFILRQLPVGVTGLLIAGVFAAAISSLDSALAALSQTVVSLVYQPRGAEARADGEARPGGTAAGGSPTAAEDRRHVRVSRVLVVVWGIVLCGAAQVAVLAWNEKYKALLDLALAMATYAAGATLAAFLLAFFRLNVDHRGIVWAAPLSVLTVFAISWHQPWAVYTTGVGVSLVVALWIGGLLRRSDAGSAAWRTDALKTVLLLASGALAVFICKHRLASGGPITVAWPWNVPIGFSVAFSLGYLLARPARTDFGSAVG